MNRFRSDLFFFLAVQAGIALAFLWLTPWGEGSYFAAVLDKHETLRAAPRPRIVFVGGSSIAWGLDSAMIREKLHREPVNLALQVSLGYELILNEAAMLVEPGDTVILAVEEAFFPPAKSTAGELVATSPALARLVPNWSGWKAVLDGGLIFMSHAVRTASAFAEAYIQSGISARTVIEDLRARSPYYRARYRLCRHCTKGVPYQRWSFNGFGDHVAHWGEGSPAVYLHPAPAPVATELAMRLQAPVVEALNQFAAHCSRNAINVVWIFPPIEAGYRAEWGPYIQVAETLLRERAQFPVLGALDESTYPRHLFFDMPVHLSGEGVAQYTMHVIDLLRPLFPETGGQTTPPACPPEPVRITPQFSDDCIAGHATICAFTPCTGKEVKLTIGCIMPAQIRPVEITAQVAGQTVGRAICNPGSEVETLTVPLTQDGFAHVDLDVSKTFRPHAYDPSSPDARDLGVIVRIQK